MKKTISYFVIPLVIFGSLLVFLVSCKKPNKEFVGTYAGTSKINGGADYKDTILITADSANNSDIYVVDSLYNFRTLDNVSGNDISVPSQTVTVYGTAGTETYTGSGSLSGSTLSLTFYYGTPMNTIAFTGTKLSN